MAHFLWPKGGNPGKQDTLGGKRVLYKPAPLVIFPFPSLKLFLVVLVTEDTPESVVSTGNQSVATETLNITCQVIFHITFLLYVLY